MALELVGVLVIALAIVCFLKYLRFLANHKHSYKPRFLNDSSIHCGGTPANYDKTRVIDKMRMSNLRDQCIISPLSDLYKRDI